MPMVIVYNWGLTEGNLAALVSSLPETVSDALSVGGVGHAGFLSMNDIEVVVHRGDPFDIHGGAEYGVHIEAMHFSEREARLLVAKLEIKKGVLESVQGHAGYVWITLLPAVFEEIHDFETIKEVEAEISSSGWR